MKKLTPVIYYLIITFLGLTGFKNNYAQPRQGDWTIPCDFGKFVITVGCSGSCITDIIYTWSNFHCDGITLVSGSIHSMRTGGWAITNNSFTIQTSVSQGTMTINGTFTPTGSSVSGTFSYNRLGTICSGNWGPVASSVEMVGNEIPDDYELYQNYPNPFNPETRIKFGIPEEALVSLIVYDPIGREVEVLLNESLPPATYSIVFNSTNLPSGIYFYKLIAGDYSSTKKMVLLK